MTEHRPSILFLSLRADFGGGPEHLWQLLKHLPSGVEASVACPAEYPYWDRYLEIVGPDNLMELPHRKFSASAFIRLWRHCRKRRFDVLHAHGKGAGLYARLLTVFSGIPSVYTFHGVHMAGYGSAKKIIYRLYERIFALFTHKAIAVSQGEHREILRNRLMPDAKIAVIENGVSIPEAVDISVAGPPWHIVSLSRFDYHKNNLFFFDIARELRDLGRLEEFVFWVVGTGPDMDIFTKRAAADGFSEIFRCPGATETPHDYFTNALCYVSTSRWEGLPLAILEAMAHGIPVVATNVVGNRDAVTDGESGFLYGEGDAKTAAAALILLADDRSRRNCMGRAARLFVKQYHHVCIMASRTVDLLCSVAQRKE